jgi:DNA-binding CsgD family transcriptional regulator
METLQSDDLSKLHQGIQQLYTLHDLDTFKVDALRIVDRLVPSDIPIFNSVNFQASQTKDTYLPSNFPSLTSQLQSIKIKYLGEHPFMQNLPQIMNGACKISDFVSQSELHSLEGIYQQFLRRLDTEEQMILLLPPPETNLWLQQVSSDKIIYGLTLNRDRRSFTERDRSILNLLRPHLSQAYENVVRCDRLQQELNEVRQSLNYLGAIVLDCVGQIKSIAPQAIIWLEAYFTKPTCTRQLPDYLRSWVKYQIDRLTQDADLADEFLPLKIQQAGRELTIRLIVDRERSQYLLLLEEKTLSSFSSLTLLGLSQRETEVLTLVMQGKENKAIGSQLSIHPGTVRKHLENIYSKWNVASRTEAIAHALTKLGIF